MESKSSMLKKLAARITTANGDVSAVQGNSMSEIIKFMQENLNVVDGELKVSALKVESAGGSVLAHFTSDVPFYSRMDAYCVCKETNDYPDLIPGEQYCLTYSVDGVTKSKTVYAVDYNGARCLADNLESDIVVTIESDYNVYLTFIFGLTPTDDGQMISGGCAYMLSSLDHGNFEIAGDIKILNIEEV